MIVCADDYGWSDDVNRATLGLVQAGRVSAVSCMVALPQCTPETLKPLLSQGNRSDIGLHLTFGKEPRDLPGLFRSSLLGRIAPAEAAKQIAQQYELFIQKLGRRPDFIDGHLHAHELPGIADGLIDFVVGLPAECQPYVRNTYLPISKIVAQGVSFWKCVAISAPAKRFRRKLEAIGIATNDGFAGVYDYRRWTRYNEYLRAFVEHMESTNGMLMVHPGFDECWRRAEYEGLRQAETLSGRVGRFNASGK
jgi:chitin disaccharide deacetylase